MKKTVLITGATGLVGTRLTELLRRAGHTVTHLSRTRNGRSPVKTYVWDIRRQQIEPEAIATADAIVHLAGANLAQGRWTEARKQEIIDSRVESAALLRKALDQVENKVEAFVSASAVGYYGADSGSTVMTEDSAPGADFLAEVCVKWEAAANAFADRCRVVKMRIGLVLARDGGVLPLVALPVRFGVGAPLGDGQQYMPWVHLDDLARMFVRAVEEEDMRGVYNAVGPNSVTNQALTRAVADVLNRPLWAPNVPSFALRLAMGEMADVALGGNNVAPTRLVHAGFSYEHPELRGALQDLLR